MKDAHVAPSTRPSATSTARVALSRAGEEVLRAVMPVVLGPLLPAGVSARQRMLDGALSAVDDYLGHLSLPLQREARVTLAVLHSLPARVLLLRTPRSWRHVAPGAIEAFLRSARNSPVSLLRRIYDFLHSMSVVGFFDLPTAWDEIGYPGPPVERPFPPNEGS